MTAFEAGAPRETFALQRMEARVAELEDALVKLTNLHHRTIKGSQLHHPAAQGWMDCECLTCARTVDLVPDRAAKWRECECRALYGPDTDGTLPAVALCSNASACAKRLGIPAC